MNIPDTLGTLDPTDSDDILEVLSRWRQGESSRGVLLATPHSPSQSLSKGFRGQDGVSGHVRMGSSVCGWVNPVSLKKGKSSIGNPVAGISAACGGGADDNGDGDGDEKGWIDGRCSLRLVALGHMDLPRQVRMVSVHRWTLYSLRYHIAYTESHHIRSHHIPPPCHFSCAVCYTVLHSAILYFDTLSCTILYKTVSYCIISSPRLLSRPTY